MSSPRDIARAITEGRAPGLPREEALQILAETILEVEEARQKLDRLIIEEITPKLRSPIKLSAYAHAHSLIYEALTGE